MKKAAPVMISRLSVNPAVAFRPKLAIRVRAYARAIKVIRFALKARGKFGALYSTSIGFTCFLALITGSASLPACSPCRVAMWKVPPADIECADSGFRISECSVPECPTRPRTAGELGLG